MARHLVVGVLSLCGALVTQVAVNAQSVLDDLYGQGVHSYFEGDFEGANRWLSQAIDQGTRDPRAYYFRGLTQLRLGAAQGAAADFAQGAQIETDGSDQFFPIAESLARVQGSARSQIEKARRDARASAVEQRLARERARYEATVAAEARVLRGAAPAVVQLQSTQAHSANFQLPYPQEQADGGLDFSIERMTISGEKIASGAAVREEAPELVDPVVPDPVTPTPRPVTPVDPPANAGNPAAPAGEGGGVFRGMFRAFSRQIPNPADAINNLPIPGAGPGTLPQGGDPNFDPNQDETPAGQNPFGPGN